METTLQDSKPPQELHDADAQRFCRRAANVMLGTGIAFLVGAFAMLAQVDKGGGGPCGVGGLIFGLAILLGLPGVVFLFLQASLRGGSRFAIGLSIAADLVLGLIFLLVVVSFGGGLARHNPVVLLIALGFLASMFKIFVDLCQAWVRSRVPRLSRF